MTKKIIIEFDVYKDVEVEEVTNLIHNLMRDTRVEVDTKLNRIGNGRPTALPHTTIRFIDFCNNNIIYKDGLFIPTRRSKK